MKGSGLAVGDRVILTVDVVWSTGPVPKGSRGTVVATKVLGTSWGDLPMAIVDWDGIGLSTWGSVSAESVVQPLK